MSDQVLAITYQRCGFATRLITSGSAWSCPGRGNYFHLNVFTCKVTWVRENDQNFRIFYQYKTFGSLPHQRVQKKAIRRSIFTR